MWRILLGLVIALTLFPLCLPWAAQAQQMGKVPRIGIFQTAESYAPIWKAFRQGLRDLGYVEGQNLVIEFRSAEGHVERLPALVAELVQRNVDVLVAGGPEINLRTARQATRTIPIVMVATDYDPIALGYIAGLPRPGGQALLFRSHR